VSNPLNRGTTPDRARDASQRPGSFKPGHKKLGGRRKGTPKALSADYKTAVLEAAYRVGRDGMGKDGIVGYLTRLLMRCPEVACILLSRVLVLQDCGSPPDDRTTKEEINQHIRDLIGRANKTGSGSPEPGLTTEWPISDLMRIAVKHPKDFGKLFAALLPQPTGRLRRSWSEA
jgi:hypothetical protein